MGVKAENLKNERIGAINYNRFGEKMKVIKYIHNNNIIVEFQDENKEQVHTAWSAFKKGAVKNPATRVDLNQKNKRLGLVNNNKQGSKMKIIEYNSPSKIIVEFQDEYKGRVNTTYYTFKNGNVINPYYPSVHGFGITGNKYPTTYKGKKIKEYTTWCDMIGRCFDENIKENYPTYRDATCCEEWILYENFYEWLHEQENFDKWVNEDYSNIDKDILFKQNKLYSPETCCLVPHNVNALFIKEDKRRTSLPIGVRKAANKYQPVLSAMKNGERNVITFPVESTLKDAFIVYKKEKEKYIKKTAQEEYEKGNITKECYNAMMRYEVEITD